MREEDVTILLAKEGNEGAFRRLYEDHFERIYRLALRYTRSPDDAEDVMQETFVKAFNGIKGFQFDRQASFSTWIHGICINCAIDHLRKRRRRRHDSTLSFDELAIDPPAGGMGQDEEAERAEILAAIERAASALSPQARIIFDLRYGQQLRIEEIASLVGTSESAVKTHLSRAHEKLRRSLAPLWRES